MSHRHKPLLILGMTLLVLGLGVGLMWRPARLRDKLDWFVGQIFATDSTYFLYSDSAYSHDQPDAVMLKLAWEKAIREDVEGCYETAEMAQRAGEDYQQVVDRCLQRDLLAMHTLFRLSAEAHFDAAASAGHASILILLLRYLGDDFFGGALAKEPIATREAVRNYLYDELGVTGDGDVPEEQVKARYPRTFTDRD